jgi:hypothetical protein
MVMLLPFLSFPILHNCSGAQPDLVRASNLSAKQHENAGILRCSTLGRLEVKPSI